MADIVASFVPDITNGNPIAPGYLEITGDGAITIADGRVFLSKGSAAAITIANPPLAMNGATLLVVSKSAYAHVVTCPSGFNLKGSSGTVTFTATTGTTALLTASEGHWFSAGMTGITTA